ncbi:MAG TPA: OsmC family protein [Gemmatimonadaceae bacterium]|nr:OsmC family protein [Gemmatimonadaceae bacterium]
MSGPAATASTDSAALPGKGWVSAETGRSGFRTRLSARKHEAFADEPLDVGGTDTGPTPYEYLLGALAGCMAMTLRMYADRKRWPLERVRISVRSGRSHEKDCAQCDVEDVGMHDIERRIELTGPLTDEQRKRLMEIADRCPVKQTLQRELRIVDG